MSAYYTEVHNNYKYKLCSINKKYDKDAKEIYIMQLYEGMKTLETCLLRKFTHWIMWRRFLTFGQRLIKYLFFIEPWQQQSASLLSLSLEGKISRRC